MSDAARIPPVAVSDRSTLVTHTGSWKYIRPQYRDRVAPCNEGCPVGIDIEAYMNLLREGRVEEAYALLLRENPMPAVTGRVCHHPCELRCNRRWFDEAVSIHAVERVLGDLALERPADRPSPPERRERVAIVGSGPAGLACAYHLAGLGYRVTVFEAGPEPGGMLRVGIPAYRLPRAILDREIERIRSHGVDIECSTRVGVDRSWSWMLETYHAVFIATGAHGARPLGVAGETAPDVRAGLDFLKEVNAGGRPDLGRRAVVVGGGNTAIDCARTARRLGAEATILYRRTRAEMPAIAQEIDEAAREGVTFVFLGAPVALHMEEGRLRTVECVRMQLGPPDDSGRRRPVPTDERFSLPADTLLSAIGETAELEAIPADLDRTSAGVTVGPYGGTNRAQVFAGGDLADAPRSVADALGAGKRAAIGIDRYLRLLDRRSPDGADPAAFRYGREGNLSMTRWRGDDPVRRSAAVNEVVPFDDLNVHHFTPVPRRPDASRPDETHPLRFEEVNLGLTRDAAFAEARRCFNCGVCNRCDLCLIFCPDVAISRLEDGAGYRIALEYCKGCGVCAEECPRGAITMTQEGR